MSFKSKRPRADIPPQSESMATHRVDSQRSELDGLTVDPYDHLVTDATMERHNAHLDGSLTPDGEPDGAPEKTEAEAIAEDRLTGEGANDRVVGVESSVLSPPRPSQRVWRPVASDESEPFTLESLQPRQIVQEFYETDDPTAQPEVTREVIDGVVWERWKIPEFSQSGIPELLVND